MTVYVITGKLGAGKTLAAVGRLRDYMRKGKRVACNFDLYPEKILPARSRITYTRLPAHVRREDLDLLGPGCDLSTYDEDANGLLVLDEAAAWINSRAWNDKSRQPVLDWFIHARKLGWDVMLVVQDISVVDKQLRDTLCEHLVVCRRLDRLAIPVISPLIRTLFSVNPRLPRIHRAKVHYGDSEEKPCVDVWHYRGGDIQPGYDTRQVFHDGRELIGGERLDMRCVYTGLSAWHLHGRYKVPWRPPAWAYHAIAYCMIAGATAFGGFAVADLGYQEKLAALQEPATETRPKAEPSDRYRLTGYLSMGARPQWFVLADGEREVVLPDRGTGINVISGTSETLRVEGPDGRWHIVTGSTGKPPRMDEDEKNRDGSSEEKTDTG